MSVENKLVKWYHENKRELPWRNTKDPYHIWISEIILQQTRVEQAIKYYYAFIDEFPTVSSLANAKEQDVLKLWQGLGYYSRARNMHKSAKYIVNELNGIFPIFYNDLIKLKGVGEYTAAAIASIAFNEKVAVLDGNVFRVLSRLYAEETPINSSKGKKVFHELASQLLENEPPELFNQAIMEFGALQCTPKNVDCSLCVIKEHCIAFALNSVSFFPVKNNSIKKKNRFFYYLFIRNNGSTYLKKRDSKDIWLGLYEFPLIEANSEISLIQLTETETWQKLFSSLNIETGYIYKKIAHQLTHQQLNIQFLEIDLELSDRLQESANGLTEVPMIEISKYPVPKPIENFINSYILND